MDSRPTRHLGLGVLMTLLLGAGSACAQSTPNSAPSAPSPPTPTSAEALTVLPPFGVRLVYSAAPGEGSWIGLAGDGRGGLVVVPEDPSEPMLRLTVTAEGTLLGVAPFRTPIRGATTLRLAQGSLFAQAHGPDGAGLYRLTDADRNGRFDPEEVQFLKPSTAASERPSQPVAVGPDHSLHVAQPQRAEPAPRGGPDEPHPQDRPDVLLPALDALVEDASGETEMRAGTVITRAQPTDLRWERLVRGLGDVSALALNADGELFALEREVAEHRGLPWYRPTRVVHCIAGGDYGWRGGPGNWPAWYPDGLPSVVDLGLGSAVAMQFGTGARFPSKYQRALFVLDPTHGRIFAVHLRSQGASYAGDYEVFLHGQPLALAGLDIGPDGALYFITGGSGAPSALYRVTYTGDESAPPAASVDAAGAEARAVRRGLEAYHGQWAAANLEALWSHLDSPDRWIRYAARLALERQPLEQWQQRAIDEPRRDAALSALLALARCGPAGVRRDWLAAWRRLAESPELTEAQELDTLRILAVAWVRFGAPEPEERELTLAMLAPLYPSPSEPLNRELSQLLIYLGAPEVAARALALFEAAPTFEEQAHYVFHLGALDRGWTIESRQRYFHALHRIRSGGAHSPELLRWFREAGLAYQDGTDLDLLITRWRQAAVATLEPSELAELEAVIRGQAVFAVPAATNRFFVKDWALEDLAPVLHEADRGRSLTRGKRAFRDAQCLACHRFGPEGGTVGPDLTAVALRSSRLELLESLLVPSKLVADEYRNATFTLVDGDDLTGRVIETKPDRYVVVSNPLTGSRLEIKKSDVVSVVTAQLSPMPDGLLAILTREEILDLLAYLESGGKQDAATFQPGL